MSGMISKILILSPEHHAALLRAIPSAATQGVISLRTNDELVGALHAAPDAGPRYLLLAREIGTDGRDDLDFETYETRDELVAAVIKWARLHRDELRAFDRGIENDGDPETWPEVRKVIDADRAAEAAQRQSQFVEHRRAEFLRLKAEFEPSPAVSVDVLLAKASELEEELADLDREQATPRAIITAGIAAGQAHLRELDAARARLAPAASIDGLEVRSTDECVDASPAIRCTPEVGCVFKTPAGYVLTIDPLDGGDCLTVNLSDVQEWLAVHGDPRPAPASHLSDRKREHVPLALVVWPGSAYDRTVVRVSADSNDVDGYASCVTEDADGERDNAAIPRRCLRDVPQLRGEPREQLTLGSTWHGPYQVRTWQDVPDGGLARSATGMWVVRRGDKFDVVKGYLQKPGEFAAPRFGDSDCEGRLYEATEMDDLAGRDTAASKACRLPAYVVMVLSIKDQTPQQFVAAELALQTTVVLP